VTGLKARRRSGAMGLESEAGSVPGSAATRRDSIRGATGKRRKAHEETGALTKKQEHMGSVDFFGSGSFRIFKEYTLF
jgi:hypothetical protein